MFKLYLIIVLLVSQDCSTQDDEGPYRGKFIGKINSYHHQVTGEVYAVDEWTLLLVNFNYDGTGDDTFFWAGDSGRPGPQGFIVPDQYGKTNILERYYNEEVRLTLPDDKKISRLKWFAIYDIGSQNTFGDVYIPDDMEAPAPRAVGPLTGTPAVSSAPVKFLDAGTLLIPEFRYDGSGEEVYFWMGVGPQPSSRGTKIPDEYGYLEPLREYKGEDIKLQLPGGSSVFDINWISIYDISAGQSLAAVLVPDALNVPPALLHTHTYKSTLPHCKQLHQDYQVSWEVFGNQITIQLAGKINEDEYMAFGISGSESRSQMLGADVAVASFDSTIRRGLATDYNITATAQCVQVLGEWKGVCRDDKSGALDSNQLLTASRENGLTVVTYRRSLQPVESIDREWVTDRPMYVVWAMGTLDHEREPAFHHTYPKRDLKLHLGANPPNNDCFTFTIGSKSTPPVWDTAELFDPAVRVFRFTLGPAGGPRGLAGRHKGRAPLTAWYVNGQLAPDLQLRRSLQYTFLVYGGNDPHSATEYHPLIVTVEPVGGLERLVESAQRAVRVLAGVTHTRRGRLSPTAAGPLCMGRHAASADRRRDADYATFRAYNRSLVWECASAQPAQLHVAPNSSWPDVVYYNSFTHSGMGGRIYIVDRHKRTLGRRSSAAVAAASAALTLLAIAAVAAFTFYTCL